MSTVGFVFGTPPGNSIDMNAQIFDSTGTIVATSYINSIVFNIYAPLKNPLVDTPLVTVIPTPVAGNTWFARWSVPKTATIGEYTFELIAITKDTPPANIDEFSKFRITGIDV